MARRGRPPGALQAKLLELLYEEGLLDADEMAQRVGETPKRVRHALWHWKKNGCVELVYALTRNGKERVDG